MKAIDNDEDLLNMALELMELSTKAEHPFVKKLLENFSRGLNELEEDFEREPFLTPLPMDKPEFTFKGSGDVKDLHCRVIQNTFISVWHCPNFWYRWQFLINGTIALQLWNTPPPIGLRLDTEALGFKVEA